MLTLLLACLSSDPTPLATSIRDVTLYPSTALVRRSASVPGSGQFVVQGLPGTIDPENVRVRCEGGDVVDVETRERLQQKLPGERLQALRERVRALARQQQLSVDEGSVLTEQAQHLEHMRASEASAHARDVVAGRATVEAWTANFDYLARKTGEVSRAQRENAWKQEDLAAQLAAAQKELGEAQSAGAVRVHDVRVTIEARGAATLDLEYFTANTGWQPAYDLRASKALDTVELVYRARVWQQTGEDWNEVALSLSTAQPQIGAQGPEPVAQWVGVYVPQHDGFVAGEAAAPASAAPEEERARYADKDGTVEKRLAGLGYAGEPAPKPRPFASVESQGLSVRFQLPKPATILSRGEPTTLLVGNAQMEIKPERHCVPALDPTVWLRGKARNSSPWTMLPGTAAVFFGADYLGPAELGTVQLGQELTLHLGADPGITARREQTEDLSKGPGFLSSRASEVKSWRLHLENHGTPGSAADGSVELIVREVLPRPRDERIEVELTRSSLEESKDERWKRERDEQGIHTWVLRVPKGDKGLDLVWQRTISYPKGAELVLE